MGFFPFLPSLLPLPFAAYLCGLAQRPGAIHQHPLVADDGARTAQHRLRAGAQRLGRGQGNGASLAEVADATGAHLFTAGAEAFAESSGKKISFSPLICVCVCLLLFPPLLLLLLLSNAKCARPTFLSSHFVSLFH